MELDPRLHFVTATALIFKEEVGGKREYLIAKRAAHEKAFPNKWTVPGGKLVVTEYKNLPKTNSVAWYNIIDWLLKKEVKEEVNLEIEKPVYFTDLVFIRPDGYPVITLAYWAKYKNGEVKLCKDLTEYAWIEVSEAKNYDLIDGIEEEIEEIDKILQKND